MASGKRQHLIETAIVLFYQNGFHATGIDSIIEAAGVARMTLYNHFKSKDDLILAAVRLSNDKFRRHFMARIKQLSPLPENRVPAVFDALHEWINSDGFCGCMVINSCAEYARPGNPVHRAGCAHKKQLLKDFTSILDEAHVPDPEQTAKQLILLTEGAIVTAHVTGDKTAALTAKKAFMKILPTP